MIVAGGPKLVLLSALLYLPATIFFVQTMREQKKPVFQAFELVLLGVLAIGAAAGTYGLVSGTIVI
jgi:arginine:ornithine antiporter/lysine permease